MARARKITAKEILGGLYDIATADATELLSLEQGVLTVADTKALPPATRRAIAAIEKAPGGVKVKFYDKLKALELLGKHLGLFDSRPETDPEGENLLQAVLTATGKELTELDTILSPADAGDDLVEQTQDPGL